MFIELSEPRCEESYPAYIGKWFIVTDDFNGFLTHSTSHGLQVHTLDKSNLDIFFWKDEICALRDVELWYDAHNVDFPFADKLQMLENGGNALQAPHSLSETMEFE